MEAEQQETSTPVKVEEALPFIAKEEVTPPAPVVEEPKPPLQPFDREDNTIPAICGDSRIIAIQYGEEKRTISVHGKVLVQYSDYFYKALNNDCIEARTLSFNFGKDASHASFDIFIDWLYGQTLDGFVLDNHLRQFHGRRFGTVEFYKELTAAWLLADYLQAPKFQNALMHCLIYEGILPQIVETTFGVADEGEVELIFRDLSALDYSSTPALWAFHCDLLAQALVLFWDLAYLGLDYKRYQEITADMDNETKHQMHFGALKRMSFKKKKTALDFKAMLLEECSVPNPRPDI